MSFKTIIIDQFCGSKLLLTNFVVVNLPFQLLFQLSSSLSLIQIFYTNNNLARISIITFQTVQIFVTVLVGERSSTRHTKEKTIDKYIHLRLKQNKTKPFRKQSLRLEEVSLLVTEIFKRDAAAVAAEDKRKACNDCRSKLLLLLGVSVLRYMSRTMH